MSKQNKIRREKIYDDFSHNEYHLLCDYYDIEEYPNKFYKIRTKEYGNIDFYPMSDKINIRKGYSNNWKTGGLEWIKNNLLKNNLQ